MRASAGDLTMSDEPTCMVWPSGQAILPGAVLVYCWCDLPETVREALSMEHYGDEDFLILTRKSNPASWLDIIEAKLCVSTSADVVVHIDDEEWRGYLTSHA